MTTVVRGATSADAALVSALNADVQALHAAALPWWFKPAGPQSFPPEAAATVIANPDNIVLVAETDGAPSGYAYAEVVSRAETPWRYAYQMVYLHQSAFVPTCAGTASAPHCSLRSAPRPSGAGSRW